MQEEFLSKYSVRNNKDLNKKYVTLKYTEKNYKEFFYGTVIYPKLK